MSQPQVLDGAAFRDVLRELRNHKSAPLHFIGVERPRVDAALRESVIPDGSTVTFYDYDDTRGDQAAYCIARVKDGSIVVTHKTYETMPGEN